MSNIRLYGIRIVLYLIIGIYPPFTSVYAQEEADTDKLFAMSMEELMNIDVKVSVASLFLEDELVVGSSVARITPDEWYSLGARRLTDALRGQTGVVQYYALKGSSVLAIRGYSTLASARGTAVLIDGIQIQDLTMGAPFMVLPSWNLGTLHSIEMIKGPGSAIYGSDAFHGVLSLKTFESDTDYYSAQCTGGYPEYYEGSIMISQGFADDLFRIDASAAYNGQGDQDIKYKYNDTEGYPDLGIQPASGTGHRSQEYDNATGILKLKYHPLDRINIKLAGYVNSWKSEEFPGLSEWNDNIPNGQGKDYMGDEGTLFTLVNTSVTYDMPKNITTEANANMSFVKTSTYYNIHPVEDFFKYYAYGRMRNSSASLLIKQPDNDMNIQWFLGYSYSDMFLTSMNEKYTMNNSTISDEKVLVDGSHRIVHSWFGQAKRGFFDNRFYILAGGRIDLYSGIGSQLTPRAGLIYLITKKSAVKALYGRAFRAPIATEQKAAGSMTLGDPDIKPETIDVYELVYTHKGENWRLNTSVFYSLWKDGIVPRSLETPVTAYGNEYDTIYENTGKNESRGAEMEGSLYLDPFSADIGFSYVISKRLDEEDNSEERYAAYPAYVAFTALHYNLKPFKTVFTLNARGEFCREEHSITENDPDSLDDYTRLDLNITKHITDRLVTALDIRNLLNDKDLTSPSVFGAEYGNPEPGISSTLRIKYAF